MSPTPASARERVIVALDVPDLGALEAFLDRLEGEPRFCKIGLELFVAAGAQAIAAVKKRGAKVFLDLKLHDIPETVGRSVAVAAGFGVELLTVHTAGGAEMLGRAVAAAGETTRILGVTVLTSLSEADLATDGITGSIAEAVARRARLARQVGLGGLVCSPHEVARARGEAPGLALVVPGVRPAGTAAGDQKRVATPAATVAAGADYLVVGRPIRDAASPAQAFRDIVAEIESVA